MGGKILRIARTKLKEKNKVEGLMLSDFKTYYKANHNQDSMVLMQRQIEQWRKVESRDRDV